ncbi:MFS transporter, partial [Paraburkholderia sp. JPY432]|nr:MFS transporter [Paraburkholderia youngii]
VGHMSATMSLGTAIGIDAGLAYAIVVLSVLMLPETRGRTLGEGIDGQGTRPNRARLVMKERP